MRVLQSPTMKMVFLTVWCCFFLRSEAKDRYASCESCLMVAKEFEKTMKEVVGERKVSLVDDLIGAGEVCNRLQAYKHFTKEKLTSSCMELIDSHYEEFHAVLMSAKPQRLDVVLCYEKSTACIGVKRHSFEDSTTKFTDSHIDALLNDNKENMRIAQPIRPGSKDEL